MPQVIGIRGTFAASETPTGTPTTVRKAPTLPTSIRHFIVDPSADAPGAKSPPAEPDANGARMSGQEFRQRSSATTSLDHYTHLFPDSEDVTRRARDAGLAAMTSD